MDALRSKILGVSFGKLLVCFFIPIGCSLYTLKAYCNKHDRILDLIRSLRNRRPPEVAPVSWEQGFTWAWNAFYNVCFSPEHATMEAMSQFGRQLEERLRGQVDADIFSWMWDRLAETGLHGKRYVEPIRPNAHE